MSSAGVIALGQIPEDLAILPMCLEGSRSPHCLSGSQLKDSIFIFVAVPGAPPMPMSVLGSESIASVKLRIQRFRGFVVNKQRLVLDGHELARNNSHVKDYGLADGNILHLVIRLADLRLINIETTSGKKFQFQVDQSRNVKYLKSKLAVEGDEDLSEDHKLECDGKELEDHQLIADISKKDGAVIHLFIRKPAKLQTQQVDIDTVVTVVTPQEKENLQNEARAVNPVEPAGVTPALIEPIIVNQKVKLSPEVMRMISSAIAGLENGYLPVMSAEGSGGVYFMQNASGEKNIAVFKPIDEEPMAENNPRGLPVSTDGEGMKRGTLVGEGAFREVAAYILDHPIGDHESEKHDGFSGVPPTALVQSLHRGKSFKIGSLQMFIENNGSCEDMGPGAFPVKEVHKIAVLDLRLANADRHAGNILVNKEEGGKYKLIPIDHGYCLPEKFEDCTFEWLYWPQAREPFSDETIAYIKTLDAEEDIKLLKFHGWELSPRCARVLRISTMLLKKGAARGLTPYDIGRILCRETVNRDSEIEDIVQEAEDHVLPGTTEVIFLETVSEIIDRHLDMKFA
ncbi:phosphatidylinositol 4-kinase gamma 4-like [Oryza brachyantha]|uniref:1-phosphatidylinositol 4-kinase n=1 Tax=Oryza brachyantha TaxID=4533 RepID=J3MDU5_ORYBR|nr:phosphatidylinositol 4-kinase gamma 4-like [Oryza brachyantha]